MANLYTKTGDKGTTGLVGGSRVSKTDVRVHCYGQIDEAQAMMGLAYALSKNEYVRETVHAIQVKLFTLGAELASDEKGLRYLGDKVLHESDVEELERIVDYCTETTGKQHDFVVPGANSASAALHVARTIVRRAERQMIAAKKSMDIRDVPMRFVNRLSDALYALARLEETEVEQQELRDRIKDIILSQLGVADQAAGASAQGGQSESSAQAGSVSASLKAAGEGVRFNLDVAKVLAEAAEKKAREMGVPVVFSAVDDGGNLLLLHRMEDAFQGSIDISMNKAYTANAFHAPTHALCDPSQPGGSLYGLNTTNNGRIVVFGGGFPLKSGGRYVGAVGVSGGTAEEDMKVASAAVDAFNALC